MNKICTKERLLDTAIELVSQTSYGHVGVNEICEKAGVTKGSFYYYFDSKAALFQAAATHYWNNMKIDMDTIFSPEHSSLEQLEGFIDYIIAKQEKAAAECDKGGGTCAFLTSTSQCIEEDTLVRETGSELVQKSIRYHMTVVKALQADGYLQEEGDPAQIAQMISHYIQGLLMYARVVSDMQVVTTDLREGIYRLVGLKPEFRRSNTPA